MTKLNVGSLAALALLALLVTTGAVADDRDLLWARGARPNVLMVVDSSGSMANKLDDCGGKIAAGDDPHDKMYQVKMAVQWFINAHPAFNLGFTFYYRNSVTFGEKLFLYRLRNNAGDGSLLATYQYRTSLSQAAQGYTADLGSDASVSVTAGSLMRFGDFTPASGSAYLSTYPGPFFGLDGTYAMTDVADGSRSGFTYVMFNGVRYTGGYRVDTYLVQPRQASDKRFYYPAYDWSSTVQSALAAYQQVHINRYEAVFDPEVQPADKLAALTALLSARQTLQSVLDAHQIGAQTLTIRSVLSTCSGTVTTNGNASTQGKCTSGWVPSQTVDRVAVSAGSLAPADISSTDTTVGTYPNNMLVHEYPGCGYSNQRTDFYANNDCNGWMGATPSTVKIPLIPIPTDDDPSLDPLISRLLGPAGNMQMFFPTKSSGSKYWPMKWDDSIQCDAVAADPDCGVWATDRSMFTYGATPLKNSLNDTQQYFEQVIFDRPDPLRFCRKNFMILLTDGVETCSSNNALCVAATDLGGRDIPVFVIGYGMGVAGNQLECIANNSGGVLYLPNNLDELIRALKRVGVEIEERSRAFSAPTVPSVELSTREKGYISTFIPLNGRSVWQGRLRCYEVDPATGRVPSTCAVVSGTTLCSIDTGQAKWDAGTLLAARDYTLRNLYFTMGLASPPTTVPGNRQAFESTTSTRPSLKALINSTLTDAQVDSTVAFIRGDRAAIDLNEDDNPDYRFPYGPNPPPVAGYVGKLGDIFHSAPVVIGRPECFQCYLQNAAFGGSADRQYSAFYTRHFLRRKVLMAGADDGIFHAFDAGFYNRNTTDFPLQYDNGLGIELWGWVPNYVMPVFDEMATAGNQFYSVDGPATVADVFIDPAHSGTPTASDRDWRTVALFGLRNGGNSVTALDITQPDTYTNRGVPVSGSGGMPACLGGAGVTGCSGNYPAVLWEFKDAEDLDTNGLEDLAQTWSKPTVAWVRVRAEGSSETTFETRNVAIFGGGYRLPVLDAATANLKYGGNFLYMIDIETGKILYKFNSGFSVPGEVGLFDYNLDGYVETVYWTDMGGRVWRLDTTTTAVYNTTSKRITSGWTPRRVLDVGTAQPFFHRPVVVLVGFDSNTGGPLLALGVGAGDREDIFQQNATAHRFYFFLDGIYTTPLNESNLVSVDLAADAASESANYLIGGTSRGWYVVLREWEKVNAPAVALGGFVVFPTFRPNESVVVDPVAGLCQQGGDARIYTLAWANANPLPSTDPALAPSRYFQMPEIIKMVSEAIVYVGEDGKLHIGASADDERIVEPMGAAAVGGMLTSWRER